VREKKEEGDQVIEDKKYNKRSCKKEKKNKYENQAKIKILKRNPC
jgi:hypothetical protein